MKGYMAVYISYLCVCVNVLCHGFHVHSDPCFTSVSFAPFDFNAPCHFTPLRNSQSAIFKCARKIAKSKVLALSCLSICLSVRIKQLASHWMNFHEIWCLSIFWKIVKKIQVSLKSDKNFWYFRWRPIYIFDHVLNNSCQIENCFRQKCRENINIHFVFNNFFCNEIMWQNMVEPGRPQMTISSMHAACWIPEATNTSEYVIFIAFPLQQWFHECTSVLHYTYIAKLLGLMPFGSFIFIYVSHVFLWIYCFWFASIFSRMQVGHQARDGYTCIGGSSMLITVHSVKWIVTCETSGPCDGMAE